MPYPFMMLQQLAATVNLFLALAVIQTLGFNRTLFVTRVQKEHSMGTGALARCFDCYVELLFHHTRIMHWNGLGVNHFFAKKSKKKYLAKSMT